MIGKARIQKTNRGDYIFIYEYTHWENSDLAGEYFQEGTDSGYVLDDNVYGTIGKDGHLTGTVTFEKEDDIFPVQQQLHVDENGCLIVDDCIVDLTDCGYVENEDEWDFVRDVTYRTLRFENSVTGETFEVNDEDKPVMLLSEKNEENTFVRLLTCHLWYEHWDIENLELISETKAIQMILKNFFG